MSTVDMMLKELDSIVPVTACDVSTHSISSVVRTIDPDPDSEVTYRPAAQQWAVCTP